MEVVFNGFVTGLLLSIFVGATFFMLIETSMTRGFKAALWFDGGVVLCDAIIITAAYFFASWINNTIIRNEYFNIAGGLVFMLFGVNYIFARRTNEDGVLLNRNVRLLLNGFIINIMNPGVILFWLGTTALTITKFRYSGKETLVYYAATLITMTAFDVIKAYFAYRISSFCSKKVLRAIYIFSGIIMIGLGIWLIVQ